MSVEIEVGLENATKVPVSPVGEKKPEAPASAPLVNPKVRRILTIAGALVLALVVGLYLYYRDRESTDDAQVDSHITPIAAKISGRVEKVLVRDNEPVKAGQLLVQIDPNDYTAALNQAKGALALAEGEARSAGVDIPRTSENVASGNSSAQAQLLVAQADYQRAQTAYQQAQTSDLAWAEANVQRSRANAQLAKADLERYLPLMQKGEISKQQYDAAKANAEASASALVADEQRYAQAKTNIEVAKSQLEAAKGRVEEAQAGILAARANSKSVEMRSADAQAKLAKVEQARAAVQAAEFNLSYCNVYAPVDGNVTNKKVEPGQIIQPGQGLMVVVPLNEVWVTANFKETQLRKMKPGQKAYLYVDTYDKTFPGHVDSLSGASGAVLSLLPPENATGNFVKVVQRIPVKIVLDPIPANVAILRPGMSVTATVVTD